MREFRTYGSVRGAPSNGRPYRNNRPVTERQHRLRNFQIAVAQVSLRADCLLYRYYAVAPRPVGVLMGR